MQLSHLTQPRSSHFHLLSIFQRHRSLFVISARFFISVPAISLLPIILSSQAIFHWHESSFLKHILDRIILYCLGARTLQTYRWVSEHLGTFWNWIQKFVSPWFKKRSLPDRTIFKLFIRVQSATLNCILVTLFMFHPVLDRVNIILSFKHAHQMPFHLLKPFARAIPSTCDALLCLLSTWASFKSWLRSQMSPLWSLAHVHNTAWTTNEMLNRFLVSVYHTLVWNFLNSKLHTIQNK